MNSRGRLICPPKADPDFMLGFGHNVGSDRGRVGISSQSIHTFLINLKCRHSEIFETIEKELVDRYFDREGHELFLVGEAFGVGKDPGDGRSGSFCSGSAFPGARGG